MSNFYLAFPNRAAMCQISQESTTTPACLLLAWDRSSTRKGKSALYAEPRSSRQPSPLGPETGRAEHVPGGARA